MTETHLAPPDSLVGWDFRFSNFAPAVVSDEYGIEYPTVEHAYQASKSLYEVERRAIAALPKPGAAKRAGRLLTVRADWEAVKLAVMGNFLSQKFVLGTAYADNLGLTGTQVLCETNFWHDQYWGDCICAAHIDTAGANWLGHLLMLRRAALALAAPLLAPRAEQHAALTEFLAGDAASG